MFSINKLYSLFAFDDKFDSVSAEEALEMISKEENPVILDVRTSAEFVGPLGHLKGAILVPVEELDRRVDELKDYKEKKVFLVCRSGVRSKYAGRYLAEKGFNNLVEIDPGMQGVNGVPGAPIERN